MKKLSFLIIIIIFHCDLFAQKDAILYNKGVKEFESGNYKVADSLYTEAIRIKPSRNYYFDRAIARINLGDTCRFCSDMKIISNGGDIEATNLLKINCLKCDKKSYNYYLLANQAINNKIFHLADSLLTLSINENPYVANVFSRGLVRLAQGDTSGYCIDLQSICNLDIEVKKIYDNNCKDTIAKNLSNNIFISILNDQIQNADNEFENKNYKNAITQYSSILKKKNNLDAVDLSNIYSKRALAIAYTSNFSDSLARKKIISDFDSAKLVCPDCLMFIRDRFDYYIFNKNFEKANEDYKLLKQMGYKDTRFGLSLSFNYNLGYYNSIGTTIGFSEFSKGYNLKHPEYFSERKMDLNTIIGGYSTYAGLNIDYIIKSKVPGLGIELITYNGLFYLNIFNFMLYFDNKTYFSYKPEIGFGAGPISISYGFIFKNKEFDNIDKHQLKLRITIPLYTRTELENLKRISNKK